MTVSPHQRPSITSGHRVGIGRSVVVGLLLAAAGLLLAACGQQVPPAVAASEAVPPQPTPGPVGPAPWLAQVCTALAPAVHPAQPFPEVDPNDPLGSRQRLLDYLGARTTAFRSALDGVNAAGPAPVPDGQSVTSPLATLLERRIATLDRERATLTSVPGTSPGTLLTTLTQTRAQLPLSGPSTALGDLALGPDLTASAVDVPACRALT